MSENTLKLIADSEARWVDLRFTDPRGKEQHVTFPASKVDGEFFAEGAMFDGSSIAGWKGINESDMILMPDDATSVVDPFTEEVTVNIRCNIVEPSTMAGYERDPRSVALRAEEYLKSTGIGDTSFFGPEPEFFVFDNVQWKADMSGAMYKIDAEEAAWASGAEFEGGNMAHRPGVKGGYFPVPPVDSAMDLRTAMCETLGAMGLTVEVHHHEVGTACQNEIGIKFNTLVNKADEVQILKYVVHNVAHAYGKTATFMPKPMFNGNGNGMHTHQSLWKNGQPLFAGDQYAGLSQDALYYIGGILNHAPALAAFTNPLTNSYKRLVPGFEAPINLAYSNRNRSATVRIPVVDSPKARRLEYRCPDSGANVYIAFAAMLMAGLDGIQNKIDPGDPMDVNIYDLPPEKLNKIGKMPSSLRDSLDALESDNEFLLKGNVFTKDVIEYWLDYKMEEEVKAIDSRPHPHEFNLYFNY